jgi:hypothetical protein
MNLKHTMTYIKTIISDYSVAIASTLFAINLIDLIADPIIKIISLLILGVTLLIKVEELLNKLPNLKKLFGIKNDNEIDK